MTPRKVLYVEEDALLRMVTVLALKDAGFEVLEAADGIEAQARLAVGHFDCVISDISMPGGVSGIEVARTAHALNPHCVTVLLSGYARSQLPPLPPTARFLPKPYRMHELLGTLDSEGSA
ncbi:response regulator [Xanthomonas hyacinthi]|uniref:Response regulator n=1 Tax=Xanthomonas hyacinthi TaxID=56455 RepID=A0A2S7F1X9_9XANT|nr:response regulator [Xanthomonas hyacinthi]KLD79003.1 response regulator receiver protein [Xanthomonas hyacinthi DSM 19077]PPU99383.1 response regulator [Xanthomonas hyacinthi]QGY78377.1 response regulator [Xanthomonas hyacinthi]